MQHALSRPACPGALLIRPDGHVAWRCEGIDGLSGLGAPGVSPVRVGHPSTRPREREGVVTDLLRKAIVEVGWRL